MWQRLETQHIYGPVQRLGERYQKGRFILTVPITCGWPCSPHYQKHKCHTGICLTVWSRHDPYVLAAPILKSYIGIVFLIK